MCVESVDSLLQILQYNDFNICFLFLLQAGAVVGTFISVLSLIFLTCFGQDVRDFLRNEELSGKDGAELLAILDQMGMYNSTKQTFRSSFSTVKLCEAC